MSDNQENTENCKLKAFEKNNYFYGKLMTVRDFVLEQNYVNDKRWLINNLLFGSGTVCGLNVSSDGTNIVIEPGFAIDNCGREIILPKNVSLTLAAKDTPEPGYKKAIYILYKECPKERVRAQTASTCDEVCANNRTEESYGFEIRDSTENDSTNEDVCGIWNNHATADFLSGRMPLRFKRRVKKYVITGDLVEISIELTNLDNSLGLSVKIEDNLFPGLKLVEGSNIFTINMLPGETIKKWYVAKVIANPPAVLNLQPMINGESIKDDQAKSTINVQLPKDIYKNISEGLISFWTKPCLEENIDSGVKIAELSLKDNKINVDNTKRKFVNNNEYMTKMLECLRVQASSLEDQTVGIKNQLAPSYITLSASDLEIKAEGKESTTITVIVKNNAGVGLPDIYVNLTSTLGTLVINNNSITGDDGKFTATLTSGNSGIATLIATTGIGTATLQVKFKSINGNIEGYVKVVDTETDNENVIIGATVSVGTITTTTTEDNGGKFLLKNVPPGNQVVWAFADRYEEGSSRINVPEGETSYDNNIFLTEISKTGGITGRVLDKDGNVIEKIVTVRAGGITTTTDESGFYTLSNVPEAKHTVTASADGYQTQNRSSVVVTAPNTTSGIDFRLEVATGTIKGTVTTSLLMTPPILGGKGLAISSISVIPGEFVRPPLTKGVPDALVSVVGTTLSTLTDQFGNYEIKNVPLGTQTVTVSAEDYNASTSSVFVEERIITLNFQLTKLVITGTVKGRVTTLKRRSVQPCTGAVPLLRTIDPGLIKTIDAPTVRPLDVTIARSIDTTIVRPVDATITRPIDTTVVRPMDATIARPLNTADIGLNLCVSGAPSSLLMEEVGIEGAIVTVAGRSAVTDVSGNYSIQNVPSGSQEVSASAAGYVAQKSTVMVVAAGTVTANFQLVVAVSRGTISGRVTQYSGRQLMLCMVGSPGAIPAVGIKGAVVSVGATSLSATTDESGNYTISSVPTGTYTVNASAQGYNTGTQGATVNENLTTTVNFALVLLPTTGEISGRVTNISGEPIGDAGINLVEVGASVVTNASGAYRFSNINPGSHKVNVNAAEYIGSSRTVSVIAGQTTSADFVLNRRKLICMVGGPDVIDIGCVVGAPDNFRIVCTVGKPSSVEICTAGGPNVEPPILERPDLVTPIDRTVVTPIDRTVVTPIDRTVVTPIDRTVVTPIDRTVVTPIDRTVVTPIDRTVVTPIDRTVVTPIDRIGALTPIRGKTKPAKTIAKKGAAGTACPSGRPTIAPEQIEVKSKSQCISGRPTIAPISEVSKAKSACPAGRPTITPLKETKKPVKAKKGTKK